MNLSTRVLSLGSLFAVFLSSSGCMSRTFQGSSVKSVEPSPYWIKIGNVTDGTVLKRFPTQSSELERGTEKCGIEANALLYLFSAPVKLQNGHYLVNRMNVPEGCRFSSGFIYVDHVAAVSPNFTEQKKDDVGYKMKIKSNSVLKLGTGKDETMERATQKCGLGAGDVSPLLGSPVLFEQQYAVILKNPLPGCQVTAGLVPKDAVEIIAPPNSGSSGGGANGTVCRNSAKSAQLPSGWFNPMPGARLAGYEGDTGLDLAGLNMDVYAVGSGTLDYSEYGHTPWVNPPDTPYSIRLKLDNPIPYTAAARITHIWYTHMAKLQFENVAEGAVRVAGGDCLGISGLGNNNAHLHIGFLLNNDLSQYDPSGYLSPWDIGRVLGSFTSGDVLPGR